MAAAKDYRGIFFNGADSKSRFTLPVELRHRVKAGNDGEQFLHLGLDEAKPYLLGFDEDHFASSKAGIELDAEVARTRGETFDRHRAAKQLAAHTETVTFDDGGRFAIPDDLREVMAIGDVLVFVGAVWTFEIWTPERFLTESEDANAIQTRRCKAFMDQFAERAAGRGRRA